MAKSLGSVTEWSDGKLKRTWAPEGNLIRKQRESLLSKMGQHISAAFVPKDKTSDDYLSFQARKLAQQYAIIRNQVSD